MIVPFAFLFFPFYGWALCFRIGTLVFLAIRIALPLPFFFLNNPTRPHARAGTKFPTFQHPNLLKHRPQNLLLKNIISDLTVALRIHIECGSRLGGVSLEFTGELNECYGVSWEVRFFFCYHFGPL